ncbi:hypothetical protein [Pectobacterium sp. CHL-2024]|uniref:hypothetical protein n=1 Tax=Pectobacterium sp. CHL-2024 TaxID=3377079 RepID=UPI003820730E
MSEIIIDLDNIHDINDYSDNTMLQQAAKKKLDILLNGFLIHLGKDPIDEKNDCQEKNGNNQLNKLQRRNNTIFVNGQRGTGKTTFLNAMLDFYSTNENNTGICPLAFIDPTLIETHQNIIVDIVVKFKQLYDKKLKYCRDQEQYNDLNKQLEQMAEGLRLLGEQKNNHNKHDDSWFLSQALKSSKSGQYLEERFHQFIDKIANVLNKKLFIIAIDDVDTNTEKAYEILENIRRYLSHPKIVVVISGDVTLYNYIVKNRKIIELTNSQRNKEKDIEKDRLVGHLTQQYLTKTFPAYQRIELKNLKQINNEVVVKIKSSNIQENKHTVDLLNEILTQSFNLKYQHINKYVEFLLPQPIRSIVQLLKQITSDKENNETPYRPEHIISALKYIFINELIEQNIDSVLLETNDPDINQIASTVFDLCHRYGELETGFYLRPDSSDNAYNAAKFYMAAILSKKLEHNTLPNALNFMLACAASANTYIHYVENSNDNDKENLSERYKNYIGLTRNENITTIAAHLGAVIATENKNHKKIHSGIIRVNRRKHNADKWEKDKFKSFTGWENLDVIGSLDQLSRKMNKKTAGGYEYGYIDYVAATTILVSSYSIQEGAEKRDYISAITLLSVISRLLEDDSTVDIRRFISLNTYSAPNFLKKLESGSDNSENYETNDSIDDTGTENKNTTHLNKMINNWKKDIQKELVTCSPLLIGKIWERIQYTLNSISEKATEKLTYNNTPGDILLSIVFSRFIWGIINSILIEEVRHNIEVPSDLVEALISAKNISTSHDELYSNMNKIKTSLSRKEKSFVSILPITHAFLACPLLLPFILLTEQSDKQKGNAEKYKITTLFNEINKLFQHESKGKILPEETKLIKESIDKKEDYLFISKLIISGCFRSGE